jgi:hypothetical protein
MPAVISMSWCSDGIIGRGVDAHGGLHVYGVTIGQFGDFFERRFFIASGRRAEL